MLLDQTKFENFLESNALALCSAGLAIRPIGASLKPVFPSGGDAVLEVIPKGVSIPPGAKLMAHWVLKGLQIFAQQFGEGYLAEEARLEVDGHTLEGWLEYYLDIQKERYLSTPTYTVADVRIDEEWVKLAEECLQLPLTDWGLQ